MTFIVIVKRFIVFVKENKEIKVKKNIMKIFPTFLHYVQKIEALGKKKRFSYKKTRLSREREQNFVTLTLHNFGRKLRNREFLLTQFFFH